MLEQYPKAITISLTLLNYISRKRGFPSDPQSAKFVARQYSPLTLIGTKNYNTGHVRSNY